MRHAGADELLARSGAADRARAVVGIGSRADHRRIADAVPALAGQPPGRCRRRHVAVAVAGHRAHRAILQAIVEPAQLLRLQFLQLPPAFLGREPVGIDQVDPLFAREFLRPGPREQDVRAVFHHRARQPHRIADVGDARHRTGPARRPVHDRGVQFVDPVIGEHRSAPGVEQRIVLQHGHRRAHRVERRAARRQHRPAGIERGAQPRFVRRPRGLVHGLAAHRSRAAVNRNAPARSGIRASFACLGHAGGDSR